MAIPVRSVRLHKQKTADDFLGSVFTVRLPWAALIPTLPVQPIGDLSSPVIEIWTISSCSGYLWPSEIANSGLRLSPELTPNLGTDVGRFASSKAVIEGSRSIIKWC
jgi:hypothetical protein